MFPRIDSSNAQLCDLRRPCIMRRGNGFQGAELKTSPHTFDYPDGHLDLSIHHPATPFGNRFAPLARPDASIHRDRDFYAFRPPRRSRNSRGTKEAKKSRDSRRNKRKFAVHLLNEQLSRNIEETLSQYNINPTPSTPIAQTTSVSQHIHGTGSTHVAPSPPQLPPIAFHGFNILEFSPSNIPPKVPLPPSAQPMLTGIPAWCPAIPSLTNNSGVSGDLPKFYDLSCLQEPKCKEMQVWRGSPVSVLKKQSRFFPPRTMSLKPTVRLPPTGPKCSIMGAGLHDPSDVAWKTTNATAKQDSITRAIERTTAAAVIAEFVDHESQLSSAANLWNILAQSTPLPNEHIDEHELDWKEEDTDNEAPPTPVFSGQLGPFELAGKDVPYVHTNSLTGYANETASQHCGGDVSGDSAIYLAEMITPENHDRSLQGLYNMPLTHSPSISSPELPESGVFVSLMNTPPGKNGLHISAQSTGEELDNSTDHFRSEQELFAAPSSVGYTGRGHSTSVCELSTFLSMGHAENCWCLACEEEPEFISETGMIDAEDTFTEDDGWMVWSTSGCENESMNGTKSGDTLEKPKSGRGSPAARSDVRPETWVGFVPSKPHRAHSFDHSEPEVQFLGYYDGACFASANADGWEWTF